MTTAVRHLFTAAEAEAALGIPAAIIRTWARRKCIYHYGLTATNTPMYDRDDLIDRNHQRLDWRTKHPGRIT